MQTEEICGLRSNIEPPTVLLLALSRLYVCCKSSAISSFCFLLMFYDIVRVILTRSNPIRCLGSEDYVR